MPSTATPVATPWLNPTEAAVYLGVEVHTVYAMRRDGRLPTNSLGTRVIRFHRDDLDKALGRTDRDRDPFDGLTDEQIAKLTAAVDQWPTLPADTRETLTALLAARKEAS